LYFVERTYNNENNRTAFELRHTENEKFSLTLLSKKGECYFSQAEFSEDNTEADVLNLALTTADAKGEHKQKYRFNKNIAGG